MRRPLTSVAAAASTLCIGLTAGAPASPEAKPESGIDVQVPDSKDAVEEYWTPDRMRGAKPTPKPLIDRQNPPATSEDDVKIESE